MWLIREALRRPIAVMIGVAGIVLCAAFALTRMPVDIFPDLDMPVIYVAQPYGGMNPAQMEGYLTYYYESNFLYISGLKSVESKSIENFALMKLTFQPGTDMSQALTQTVAFVSRSQAYMPAGTVPPFVLRFDAGSVPVGYLVFSSSTRGTNEVQDLALNRVRPLLTTLPGVSAPPPFGGSSRTIVIHVDPNKLSGYHLSASQVVKSLLSGNAIAPAGDVRAGTLDRIVTTNAVVSDIHDLESLPIRTGNGPAVYLRDIGSVEDGADLTLGYALADGHRSVYLPVTKRADASTLAVVHEVKASMSRFENVLPRDVHVRFAFDQSGYVSQALDSLVHEGILGALLTGLMVLLFLGDWRSSAIVVVFIPFSLVVAVVGLWLCDQTVNIMTLGGLALAVGILVDEATVEIENIHRNLDSTTSVARAAFDATQQTFVPRFLATLAILAVFVPSFLMQGVTRALFVPLSISVGFAMVAAFVLSSTLVPILFIWMHRHGVAHSPGGDGRGAFARFRDAYAKMLQALFERRKVLLWIYAAVATLVILGLGPLLGREMFPRVESNEFQLRLRAPAGTRIEVTEQMALQALAEIRTLAGPGNVSGSIGYVGTYPPSYPMSLIYLWTDGPQEAVLRVALRKGSAIRVRDLEERLRVELKRAMPDTAVLFEPGDVVSQIMDFGAPTPIEVAFHGPDLASDHAYAERVRAQLSANAYLRDLQYGEPLAYPSIDVDIDRVRAGQLGLTTQQIVQSLSTATWSSRFVARNFWQDPRSGVGYQVQIEVPQEQMKSPDDVAKIPLAETGPSGHPNLGDVARITYGSVAGEYDRFDMQRMVTLQANIEGEDLGRAADQVDAAIRSAGAAPRGVTVQVRGQSELMRDTLSNLGLSVAFAVVVIFLLLAANFQSIRLSLVVVSTLPAVICGVILVLLLTGTSLNLQSFMGAIMALGVSVANSILLVTVAEDRRRAGASAAQAALYGSTSRLRPILMTSLAMIAGMIPMALALGEGSQQSAPLGRAVIGGLAASTLATLLVLPIIFSETQRRATTASPSLDPDDPSSAHYVQGAQSE
jgi:multidrug efflux pump subunit AcrB